MILAGGAGTRLLAVTGGVPKQFWRPTGRLSLLEETLARVAPLTPLERCVIVIGDGHREYIGRSAIGAARVVAQPANRGTAAGVLYGLQSILSIDPNAVVLITPADHGVVKPSLLIAAIRKGVKHVESHDEVVLLGVAPSLAHTDHGWIAMAPEGSPAGIRRVAGFFEKPSRATARQLLKLGSLLNTMVMAGRGQTLLELCRDRVPDLTACFAEALTLPPDIGDAEVRARYPSLPTYDFSRQVLTGAAGLRALRIPAEAGWSDLGTPERVAQWLGVGSEPLRAASQPQPFVSTGLPAVVG